MIFSPLGVLIAQAGVSLAQSGSPSTWLIPESATAAIYALIGASIVLLKRKGEGKIAMDEAEGADALEARKEGRTHQLTREQEIQRRLDAKEAELEASYKSQILHTANELHDFKKKLHEARNDNLKMLERAMASEAQCDRLNAHHESIVSFMTAQYEARLSYMQSEIDRLRRSRDHFVRVSQDAAQDMSLMGLMEASEQIATEISEATDTSHPSIVVKKDG